MVASNRKQYVSVNEASRRRFMLVSSNRVANVHASYFHWWILEKLQATHQPKNHLCPVYFVLVPPISQSHNFSFFPWLFPFFLFGLQPVIFRRISGMLTRNLRLNIRILPFFETCRGEIFQNCALHFAGSKRLIFKVNRAILPLSIFYVSFCWFLCLVRTFIVGFIEVQCLPSL